MAHTLLSRLLSIAGITCALLLTGLVPAGAYAEADYQTGTAATPSVSVGPQYDTTHVYVSNEDIDAFVNSFVATFGGKASPRAVFTVTPTPSKTASQYVQTPVGMLSVFAFQTPIPYPFGLERHGYLVNNIDKAVKAARASGADVLVETFDDPIGKDAIIQWPGGVNMQLYWHTKAPSYAPLETIPDNRVYVSKEASGKFVRSFIRFSHGKIVSDNRSADAGEIGRPGETVHRLRIQSGFGKMVVFVTDGKLPYPFGHDTTGYQVADLGATLEKAQANGAKVLSQPFQTDIGKSAIVEFPGGYIAEIHDTAAQ
ncbi:VOC family protein [Paraburkholderia caffeinilytica]|uniref:glyoxalase n=1 Tax=Paraburkholderia caffeinilytica TaxID=1761016 RepID=UPI0038B7C530